MLSVADTHASHAPHAPQATAPEAVSLRRNMEIIARTLNLGLGDGPEAGLAFSVGRSVSATVAPGRNGRLVAIMRIAPADRVPPALWIGALSEAAGWGLHGERQRFVVIDGHFALSWTTPALPEGELLDTLFDLFATALALAELLTPGVH